MGKTLAQSIPEEVIDTNTKTSNPVDWTEHLLRVYISMFVYVCLRELGTADAGMRERWKKPFIFY